MNLFWWICLAFKRAASPYAYMREQVGTKTVDIYKYTKLVWIMQLYITHLLVA